MDGIVAGSVWECAILNPSELRQDGQAGVASCARGREGKFPRNWLDFVPESFEILVNCTDAPKALRLLLMVQGRVCFGQRVSFA